MAENRTLAEVRTEAEQQVKLWNTAYFENDLNAVSEANSKLEDLEKEYITIVQADTFSKLAATEQPMVEAIRQFTYTVIKHKDTADKEANIVTRELIDKDRQIDLLRFDGYCSKADKKIAHNPMWPHMVQKFNLLMCLRAATELGVSGKEINDSYFMSEQAAAIDMGKTPTSNTQILKQLQACIDALIYEEGEHGNIYKATSKDVAYIVSTYTKKGKNALSVATARHNAMRGLIATVAHRIVTGDVYTVEFQEAKKK